MHRTGRGPSLAKRCAGIKEKVLFNFSQHPALLPYNDISSLPPFIFIKTILKDSFGREGKGREGGGCVLQPPPASFLVLQLHLATGPRNLPGPGPAAGMRDAGCGGMRRDAAAESPRIPGLQPAFPSLQPQGAHHPLLADYRLL